MVMNMFLTTYTDYYILEDTKMYGTLDMFSAFPFKNYLQSLKQLVRNPNKLLPQIKRCLHEKDSSLLTRDTVENKNVSFSIRKDLYHQIILMLNIRIAHI